MALDYSLLRVASIAAVAALAIGAPDRDAFAAVVWSVAFGHYFIGLWYSRRELRRAGAEGGGGRRLAVLGAAGIALFAADLPLAFYFGIHHALNESYMLDRVTRAASSPQVRALRAAGLVLHLVLYTALLRDRPAFVELGLDPALLWGALALAYTLFAVLLVRARGVLSPREMLDNASLEVLGLGLLAASTVVEFNVLQIACYHFLFWIGFPARGMRSDSRALLAYLGLTVGVTGVCMLFSPLAIFDAHFAKETYRALFVVFSFVHITLSFAVSSANPGWVRRIWVRDRLPARAAA